MLDWISGSVSTDHSYLSVHHLFNILLCITLYVSLVQWFYGL